jgi:hypothetical protein
VGEHERAAVGLGLQREPELVRSERPGERGRRIELGDLPLLASQLELRAERERPVGGGGHPAANLGRLADRAPHPLDRVREVALQP